jgi:hypothetical protein
VLRHELSGRLIGLGVLSWPLVIRWLHDAVLEELLDRAGYAVGDPPVRVAGQRALTRLAPTS